MGHNLFNRTMAFVGDPPWHELGKEVPPDVNSEQMLRAAGLNWKVSKSPASGARIIRRWDGTDIFDRYFIEREAIGREQTAPILGLVSSGYELLQNREAFAFFDPFLEAGQASYATAGALGNGCKFAFNNDPLRGGFRVQS